MPLEVLHITLVLFGLGESGKSTEIAALARRGVLLSRIQPELPGFELADHGNRDAGSRGFVAHTQRG